MLLAHNLESIFRYQYLEIFSEICVMPGELQKLQKKIPDAVNS